MVEPQRWTEDELEEERLKAIELFRRERLDEPVDMYSEAFDDYMGSVENLLEETVDLSKLDNETLSSILTSSSSFEAFRYLSGPPISTDDLQTLAEAVSLAPSRLKNDLEAMKRIKWIIMNCIDRRRFPWISEEREPDDSERQAAILASAALMAYQRIQTARRHAAKNTQEGRVSAILTARGFEGIKPSKEVSTLAQAPSPGQFCGERWFAGRKADFLVGLWDTRCAPIECKVSNSELNSVKRLNNDAAAKAATWLKDFGKRNVVPIAILSGCYKLSSLVQAQEAGLTLIWAHDLEKLIDWIERTRGAKRATKKAGKRRKKRS